MTYAFAERFGTTCLDFTHIVLPESLDDDARDGFIAQAMDYTNERFQRELVWIKKSHPDAELYLGGEPSGKLILSCKFATHADADRFKLQFEGV